MIEVRHTDEFLDWFNALRDIKARVRDQVRIDRLAQGNPGDVKSVGHGVSEIRISYAGGYRVYFTRKGHEVVVLLGGGDKSTQQSDISAAQALAKVV
jgi:putative addiction module killer protein